VRSTSRQARLAAAIRAKLAPEPGASSVQDGRSFVRPKFRNPKEHAQTWAGRGKTPQWFSDHLAAGGTEAECVIPAEGAV
jgi:DNA-binding protein H-NS